MSNRFVHRHMELCLGAAGLHAIDRAVSGLDRRASSRDRLTTSRVFVWLGAAALAGLLGAGPARATTFDFYVNGTVISGIDQTNTFGLGADADLSNHTYLAHFVYDTSTASPTVGAGLYQSVGGSFDNTMSSVYATITINGVTLPIDGKYDGEIYLDNNYNTPHAANLEFDVGAGTDIANASNNTGFFGPYLLLGGTFHSPDFLASFDPNALGTPFFVNPQSGDTLYSTFWLPAADGIDENMFNLDVEHVANFYLGDAGAVGVAGLGDAGSVPAGVTVIEVSPPSSRVNTDVPEPPAVAIMGVGLVALMLQRRRQSA